MDTCPFTCSSFTDAPRGWSQADLARHLGPGFTASAISLMEGLRLKPSPRQSRRLREVFGDEAESMLAPVNPGHI